MHHNLIIKDGNTTKVVKEVLVDGIQFVDEAPREGSTNPVTSGGVKSAIDGAVGDAAAALQEQIDDIAEKAGSGYIPKGEATVATLNALSGQENGELYTMTDAGTLTDGSLAVVAGDTVAWDATNEVWYKAMDYAPRQYGTNEVHNLQTSITAFRTDDVIAVDGPSGTAKMSKDDLLNVTAENAKDSLAPTFEGKVDLLGDNAKFIDVVKSVNIFDEQAITRGKTLSSTDGTIRDDVNWLVSDFMPIEPETSYWLGFYAIRAFYDADKVYISGSALGTSDTVTSPSGAAFARVSFNQTSAIRYTPDTYMAYKVSDAPSGYVEGNEKALLGECPNHYANGIKTTAEGTSINVSDVDANLQLLKIEVRSENLLNPTCQLYLQNSSNNIVTSTKKNGNAFRVREGEKIVVGGDLSSFNSSAVRIGFVKDFPVAGVAMQGYQPATAGTILTVPSGCNWCFWATGSYNTESISSQAYITRNVGSPSYKAYVSVSGTSATVNGLSLSVSNYGDIKIAHRGNALQVSSLLDVDFSVEYIRNLQDVLDEIGVLPSDIVIEGTGNSAYTVVGKDSEGAKSPMCVSVGYQNMKNSGGLKCVVVGNENMRDCTGNENCAFGYHSQFRTTSGEHNSSFGSEASDDNTTGSYNCALGSHAMQRNSKGSYNVAIGGNAMKGEYPSFDSTVAFGNNTAIGSESMFYVKHNGNRNTGVGAQTLKNVRSGAGNTAVGAFAMVNANTRSGCIAIGQYAGKGADGDNQLWVGNADSPTKTTTIIYGEMHQDNLAGQFLRINGNFELPSIPTSDPHVAGRLWSDGGTLKISAG